MVKHIIVTLFFITLTTQNALAHRISVKVKLSPIGLFEISSNNLFGEIRQRPITKSNNRVIESSRLSIKTENLKTGIKLRDDHLHQFLQAKKYPRIFMQNIRIKESQGSGDITINNVTKNIKFEVQYRNKELFSFFKINLFDFNLKPKVFMGVKTDNIVNINVYISKKDLVSK